MNRVMYFYTVNGRIIRKCLKYKGFTTWRSKLEKVIFSL